MSGRRGFILRAAGLAAALLAAGLGQAGTRRRVGFLSPLFSRDADPVFGPFLQALRALGYRENDNLELEYRSANGQMARLDALAAELVARNVELIVAVAPPAIHAARRATASLPIVMAFSGDITGLTILAPDLSVKRLELMREIAPSLERVAVLANPATQTSREQLDNVRAAGRALGVSIHAAEASTPGALQAAFATLAGARPQMLLVLSDPLFFAERQRLAELAFAHRLPMMADWKETAKAGALIAYGPNLAALAARAAVFVDRILRGERPADLPVEQPSQFDLIVNLRTAQRLGITLPGSVLLRADATIE
jgi:putative ABC transport system substrate-binding protein